MSNADKVMEWLDMPEAFKNAVKLPRNSDIVCYNSYWAFKYGKKYFG